MSTKEMLNAIANDKLSDLKELFFNQMNVEMANKLNERKVEIAQNYFGRKSVNENSKVE